MDSSRINFDLSPPPPAYSEQELDEKISLASQQSLISHQQRQAEYDEEWEEWDEAKFEEAAASFKNMTLQSSAGGSGTQRMTATSGQSSKGGFNAATQPLRIHKKMLSSEKSSPPAEKSKEFLLAEGDGSSSSRVSPPPAAPPYTLKTELEPSSAELSPISPLPNPYASEDQEDSSRAPTISAPDAHVYEQGPPDLSDAPPALTDDSLPPPPFTSCEGQSNDHHTGTLRSPVASSFSATPSTVPTPVTGDTSPAYSPRPDTNLSFEASSTVNSQQRYMLSPNPQPAPVTYSTRPVLPHPGPGNRAMPHANLPSPSISSPYRQRDPQPNRYSALPPPPQINVDLSTVYGKRPAGKVVQQALPTQQTFDPTAFYNSAVSAHLGPNYSKTPANPTDPRRQSYQPSVMTPGLYNFPQAASSLVPDNRNRLSSGTLPLQSPYNPRPLSYNAVQQDPLIRSPTPTYPPGAANPMPQMLAAANGNYYNQSSTPYSTTNRSQVTWTEHFNSLR